MKHFTLRQILNACGGEYTGNDNLLDLPVKNILTDSRQVEENSLFAAIAGERVDGHDFIESCYSHGALCVLCEKPPVSLPDEKACILVSSTLEALKMIAKAYREMFSIPFIGITGSVGKTSTKEMIASVLSQKFCVHKTQGNFNNELGVPLTLFGLEEKHQVAVIEMGISDFGEMTRLSTIVQPDFCVITNIGYCHLEKLIDLDGVLKAKTEMFKSMSKTGRVILNGDDEKLRTVTQVNGISPIFYGFSSSNRYFCKGLVNNSDNEITCTFCYDNQELNVVIPAIGNHMAANALAAVAIARELNMTNEEIVKGIACYKTVGSRSNVIKTHGLTIIDDCYNANPTSMKSSIDMLNNFAGRHVCILGDMKELGENESSLHFETGVYAGTNSDIVICIGELSAEIARGARFCGNSRSYHFNTAQDAVIYMKHILKKGDVVLVKASRAMKLEEVVSKLYTLSI